MSRMMQILPLLVGAMISEGIVDEAPRPRSPTADWARRRAAEQEATAAPLREERRQRKAAAWAARQPKVTP